jgi:Tfx family DNA-binding protein
MGEGPAAREGLLTRRQVAVLKLRRQGLSQQEVAEILGTTRSNVSILEKRALQNVFRARATLREWTMIHAPISITVPAGTDLFDLPGLVFQEADRAGIKLEIGSVDIVRPDQGEGAGGAEEEGRRPGPGGRRHRRTASSSSQKLCRHRFDLSLSEFEDIWPGCYA